jgi:hypothetical protein
LGFSVYAMMMLLISLQNRPVGTGRRSYLKPCASGLNR